MAHHPVGNHNDADTEHFQDVLARSQQKSLSRRQVIRGGVGLAAIQLAKQLGARVWATSRDEAKRAAALTLGADEAFEPGARLPERVDAVMESVGEATWSHSLKSLRPGGRLVVCGATSGPNPPADLNRVFFLQLEVLGSTMGTREELERLIDLVVSSGVRPTISATYSLADAREGFVQLADGDVITTTIEGIGTMTNRCVRVSDYAKVGSA